MNPAQTIFLQPDAPRLTWQGVISLERTDEWVAPWRLPHQARGLFPPERLQEYGDTNIHYVDGLTNLGADHAHLLLDDLHPSAEGHKLMGENISRAFAKTLTP